MMTKYLKTFTQPIAFGRDMGYPETIHRVYDDFGQLCKDYGKKSNESYHVLTPVSKEELDALVPNTLAAIKEQEDIQKRRSVEMEIESLNEKLKHMP